MTATITDVRAWEALDSRGKPTVACKITTSAGASGAATVPSGASTGTNEANELRDGGPRYEGNGVLDAVRNVNTILREAVIGWDVSDQTGIDAAMEAVDASPGFAQVGANAVLAVSLASVIAAAADAKEPLYLHGTNSPSTLPMPMINIFSGGAHAGQAIDIQDVLVIPTGARSVAEALEMAVATRRASADILRRQGFNADLVADEGGLAAPLHSNRAALELVAQGIELAGMRLGTDAGLAIDVAANQMLRDGRLFLASEGREVTDDEWITELISWVSEFPILSLEDILPDTAWEAWQRASSRFPAGLQLLGDDLFVTSTRLLERGIDHEIANAILIKPNQAGTVSRTKRAVDLAKVAGYRTVISARSGETEDSWLADLAVAWSTGQIKVGSTTRSERTAKWNRLLAIEAESGLPLSQWAAPIARRLEDQAPPADTSTTTPSL